MKNEVIYFKRHIDSHLEKWKNESNRKPLLLRGTRQTGKSSAVRNLAKKFDYFLKINFGEDKTAREVFENSNLTPQLLCEKLYSIYDIPVVEGQTLLFFDEIQACIPVISSLRFFYERYNQ
jgi:predicted AAA+ superfamily ATPase